MQSTLMMNDDNMAPLLMCSGVVVLATVAAIVVLVLKEGRTSSSSSSSSAVVYSDDVWKPSCHAVSPAFLLGFRSLAFVYTATILAADVAYSGFSVFYFYTQWSFLLLVFYFGLSTLTSARAASRSRLARIYGLDGDRSIGFLKGYSYNGNGYYPDIEQNKSNAIAMLQMYWETVFAETRERASASGVLMQIVFQTVSGAAVLTDVVYWLGIFPLLREIPRAYDFLEINLHGANFVLLVTEIFLNRMSFPWFRGAYFTLWTGVYVLFQWSVHALGVQWWPYPFLNPTQTLAPAWYGILCVGHVMCYGFMWLIVKLKHRLLGCYVTR